MIKFNTRMAKSGVASKSSAVMTSQTSSVDCLYKNNGFPKTTKCAVTASGWMLS